MIGAKREDLGTSMMDRPFRGPGHYEEVHADIFFGRETDIKVIAANLISTRMTLLYGASGAGKSSVLRAGVMHRLDLEARKNLEYTKDEKSAAEFIPVIFADWKDEPLPALIKTIYEAIEKLPHERSPLPQPGPTLAATIKSLSRHLDSELLIILDQFEEYFLYYPALDGFASAFKEAASTPNHPANFLISMREDSIAKLDVFHDAIPNIGRNSVRLNHLDVNSAREAIEGPLRYYNEVNLSRARKVHMDKKLPKTVLAQIAVGRLNFEEARGEVSTAKQAIRYCEAPFLQIVMMRLWEKDVHEGSGTLKVSSLRELGGAKGIVEGHLDLVMKTLSDAECEIASRVFNHLVTPTKMKIAHRASDLTKYVRRSEEGEHKLSVKINSVLKKLCGPGFLILRDVTPTEDRRHPRYEIFHDVLASAILSWRAGFEKKNAVESAVAEAKAIATSEAYTEVAKRIESSQGIRSEGLMLRNLARAIIADSNNTAAVCMASKSLLEKEWCRPMWQWQIPESGSIFAAASFSPGNKEIAGITQDGFLVRWNAETGRLLSERQIVFGNRSSEKLVMNSAIFSSSGDRLFIATSNSIRIWRRTEGDFDEIDEGAIPTSQQLRLVACSHDGKILLANPGTWRDFTCSVFRPGNQKPQVAQLTNVSAADVSPDGKWIATSSPEGEVRLWDSRTLKPIDSPEVSSHFSLGSPKRTGDRYVFSALFAAQGREVITVGIERPATFWNLRTGETRELVSPIRGHHIRVVPGPHIAGHRHFAVSSSQVVVLWDYEDFNSPIMQPIPITDGYSLPSFGKAGKRLLIMSGLVWNSWDTLQVWNIEPLPVAPCHVKFDGKNCPRWLSKLAMSLSAPHSMREFGEAPPMSMTDIQRAHSQDTDTRKGQYAHIWMRFFQKPTRNEAVAKVPSLSTSA